MHGDLHLEEHEDERERDGRNEQRVLVDLHIAEHQQPEVQQDVHQVRDLPVQVLQRRVRLLAAPPPPPHYSRLRPRGLGFGLGFWTEHVSDLTCFGLDMFRT